MGQSVLLVDWVLLRYVIASSRAWVRIPAQVPVLILEIKWFYLNHLFALNSAEVAQLEYYSD